MTVRAPAMMFERVVDRQRREDHIALLHVLHRPARAGLLKRLPGRCRRAQVLAEVLTEPGAPTHLEDLVVVLALDSHLLVHLPLAVLGQIAARQFHGGEPQHAENVRSIGGELDGIDVAQLFHGAKHRLPGDVHTRYEVGIAHPHDIRREEVHHQRQRHPVRSAAGHRSLQALHPLEEERRRGEAARAAAGAGVRFVRIGHLSSPPALSWRR